MTQLSEFDLIKVDTITIGKRHREELDIPSMITSLEAIGQLQPIGLTPEYKLVFGERRLRAAIKMGWPYIEAIVKPRRELLEELAENTDRKPFTPLELVNIGREIEGNIREEAKERQASTSGKLPEVKTGNTRDQVAKLLGTSGRTYEKAKAVVEAAEADPDRFEHLVSEMQRTKKVNAAFSKLKKADDEDRVLDLEPVEGKFHTLIFDCPWDFTWLSKSSASAPGYATMSLEEIEDINPRQWAMDDFCHLYMWAPNNFVSEACRIMEAWGFDHRSVITWRKPKIGMGHYFRNDTEQILFGTIGKKTTRADNIPTWFEGSTGVGEHSAKPDEFFDLVQRASYPPFGEGFGRKERDLITNLYEKIKS